MSKKSKHFIVFLLVPIMLVLTFTGLVSCMQNPDNYTDEEHVQRVSERIEEKYMKDTTYQTFLDEGDELTGFKVYPLYNEYDELAYFLVEFEPYGFMYVRITNYTALYACNAHNSMYSEQTFIRIPWQRYTISEEQDQPWPDTDKRWEVDENGEFIYYNKSHFNVAGIKDEKRYLFKIKYGGSSYYVVAVKRENKYLNLISMEEMDLEDGTSAKKQAVASVVFVGDRHFDL